jgi:hypothetical protein
MFISCPYRCHCLPSQPKTLTRSFLIEDDHTISTIKKAVFFDKKILLGYLRPFPEKTKIAGYLRQSALKELDFSQEPIFSSVLRGLIHEFLFAADPRKKEAGCSSSFFLGAVIFADHLRLGIRAKLTSCSVCEAEFAASDAIGQRKTLCCQNGPRTSC